MLQKLWYDRPVRTQLLIAVGVINLLAALLAGAVSILNTRTATRVEIEASLEVAQRFVAATMKDLAAQDRLSQLNRNCRFQLKHLPPCPHHVHGRDRPAHRRVAATAEQRGARDE